MMQPLPTPILQVHERGLDSDFTLALLMSALTNSVASGSGGNSKKLKLILMSATMATDKFAGYLGQVCGSHKPTTGHGPPRLTPY